MGLEDTIRRRLARVNRGRAFKVCVENLHDTDSGGLHLMLRVDRKKSSFLEQFYIPAIMRADLEHGAQNESLDNKFRL